MSQKEIRRTIIQYLDSGVFSRAAQCYERLLFLGKLRQHEYLRLKMIYERFGNPKAAQRVSTKYERIYKIEL